MSKEPFLALDGLIIPNSQLDVKNFSSSSLFSVKANEIRLVTYPILDGLIIPNSRRLVKNFFRAHLFFFFQAERAG